MIFTFLNSIGASSFEVCLLWLRHFPLFSVRFWAPKYSQFYAYETWEYLCDR